MVLSLGACLVAGYVLAQEPDTTKTIHLNHMHRQPWFLEVLVSSLVGWVVGMVKGFAGTRDWLARYWTNSPKVVTFVLDFLVFVFVGAYFGTGIYNPTNFQAALAAGLSWPIGLGALATTETL
jgi:hypothetical protein